MWAGLNIVGCPPYAECWLRDPRNIRCNIKRNIKCPLFHTYDEIAKDQAFERLKMLQSGERVANRD